MLTAELPGARLINTNAMARPAVFLGILFVLVGILFLLFKRPMYVLTFDEDIAAVDGLPVRMMSMI
jgi:ABC-type Mn2+/Zn2+ transport system permease subunit